MTINATPKTDETIENNQGIQDSTTTAKQQYAEHLAEIFGESVVFIQDTETENNEKVIPQGRRELDVGNDWIHIPGDIIRRKALGLDSIEKAYTYQIDGVDVYVAESAQGERVKFVLSEEDPEAQDYMLHIMKGVDSDSGMKGIIDNIRNGLIEKGVTVFTHPLHISIDGTMLIVENQPLDSGNKSAHTSPFFKEFHHFKIGENKKVHPIEMKKTYEKKPEIVAKELEIIKAILAYKNQPQAFSGYRDAVRYMQSLLKKKDTEFDQEMNTLERKNIYDKYLVTKDNFFSIQNEEKYDEATREKRSEGEHFLGTCPSWKGFKKNEIDISPDNYSDIQFYTIKNRSGELVFCIEPHTKQCFFVGHTKHQNGYFYHGTERYPFYQNSQTHTTEQGFCSDEFIEHVQKLGTPSSQKDFINNRNDFLKILADGMNFFRFLNSQK